MSNVNFMQIFKLWSYLIAVTESLHDCPKFCFSPTFFILNVCVVYGQESRHSHPSLFSCWTHRVTLSSRVWCSGTVSKSMTIIKSTSESLYKPSYASVIHTALALLMLIHIYYLIRDELLSFLGFLMFNYPFKLKKHSNTGLMFADDTHLYICVNMSLHNCCFLLQ